MDKQDFTEERLQHAREYAEKCLKDESEALLSLIPQLGDDFEKAVRLIFSCKGKVIVTGVGKSGHIGAKIAATLCSTGTPAFFINPLDAFHGDLGAFTADDVVIAISYSGNTDELLRFIPILLKEKIKIIGMCGFKDSLLGRSCDVFLSAHIKREACPLNLAPTSSTTAALALGDALAIALMQARDFKPKDFAQFHPGGSLGRRLLTTAADVMRTEDLPYLQENTLLGDAIITISDKKLGLGLVVNSEGVLQGLITDGDIRRAMLKNQSRFFETKACEIMTVNPTTVKAATRIADVEKLFKDKLIHSVPVMTDDGRKVLGVVDHFSCMI